MSDVPVDVDEVNGTSIARFHELGQPTQTCGVGGCGVCDSGRTEIHRAVEVGERFHVFLPTGNGGGDVDARPACVRTFTIISRISETDTCSHRKQRLYLHAVIRLIKPHQPRREPIILKILPRHGLSIVFPPSRMIVPE